LRVLFAGLGSIGQRHLRNLHALVGPRLKVAAFRTRRSALAPEHGDLERTGQLEAKYGIQLFECLEHALETFKPGVVFICNPTSLHIGTALVAARAGINLFIEKPLGTDIAGADELARIVEEKNLTALVGYQMRFHPCFVRLREWLAEQVIGRLVAVRAQQGEYLPDYHPYEDYRLSYASKSSLGGGVVLTQIHDLDYLVALFGTPDRVFAMGGHLSSLEIDVEDVASISLAMRNEGRLLPVHLHQDYVTRVPVRNCWLLGENGSVDVDFRAFSIKRTPTTHDEPEFISFPDFDRNRMFSDVVRHLLACLNGTERPIVGIRDAMVTQRVGDAVRESLRTGRVIEPFLGHSRRV